LQASGTVTEFAAPDDGLLVDLLASIAPGEPDRRRMLAQNPAEFFGFG
jgi:2-pyrone-4,6-dicarboxylate lactonase